MTTDTQSALLAAILADPADDTARLVYADWLDENGHPERAAFIRVQVELARGSDCVTCKMKKAATEFGCAVPVCREQDPLRARDIVFEVRPAQETGGHNYAAAATESEMWEQFRRRVFRRG